MKVGRLKALLRDVPDDVNLYVSDLDDFDSDFELQEYVEGYTYLDLIIPYYIESCVKDGEKNA